jgi:hypothetical protein
MRADPSPSIVRPVRRRPVQYLRLAMAVATVVAMAIWVVVEVRGRSPRTSFNDSTPVSLPTAGPSVVSTVHPVSGFRHPGVVVTAEQLDFVRARVRAGEQPWIGAFHTLSRSAYANLGWRPHPSSTIDCPGSGDCRNEWSDAVAAYSHALLWYLTHNREHADKAVEIIDAWSLAMPQHSGINAPLQAGWSAATLVRAAEIVKHTYPGWDPAAVSRAEALFRDAYLPLVAEGGAAGRGGNWDLIILDAAASIAVFLDDRPLLERVIEKWRARLPAYIYLSADGPSPVGPPGTVPGTVDIVDFWYDQVTYVDGLAQETCRDLAHTAWGLEALAQIAETAWIQGIDLYAEAQERLVSALEFHAGLALGADVPDWLCGGRLNETFTPIPEIAYNHYHNRLGIGLLQTGRLIEAERPQLPSHFYGWATLTHADNPTPTPAATPETE